MASTPPWRLAALCLLVACGGPDPDDDGGSGDAADWGGLGGGGEATDPPSGTGPAGGGRTEGQVCERWRADRTALSEGTWSGDADTCDPGTLSQDGIDHTLIQVNLMRWLAWQPPVVTSPEMNDEAQRCSLLMQANGTIDHFPDAGWDCYEPVGAGAASESNLATAPSVFAIDLYMVDRGNLSTLGHRRWILSDRVGPIGIGGTSGFSCLLVIGGDGGPASDFTAWPPPGPFPIQAADMGFAGHVDDTGWSVQSDTIDLTGAEMVVRSGGRDLPVRTTELLPGYGSASALSVIPDGWSMAPGERYDIEVVGASRPIAYTVEPVACLEEL